MKKTKTDLIANAMQFASIAHKDQTRKYGSKKPYISHPIRVYELLHSVTDDTDVLCAGLLHDVVEDTIYGYEDIKQLFNKRIADIVLEVSKDENKNFDLKTKEGIMVKCADILHNLSDNSDEKYINKIMRNMRGFTK